MLGMMGGLTRMDGMTGWKDGGGAKHMAHVQIPRLENMELRPSAYSLNFSHFSSIPTDEPIS